MTSVNYLWNPLNDNIVREFDDGGATVAEYTTEPEQFGNVISQRRDGEDDYFHYDGVGSTLAVTNQAGTVTDTRAYIAFGETTHESGTTVFPFQYVGKNEYYRDDFAGEYMVRARTLLPPLGRWLSMDPVNARDFLTHYPYVSNNPPNTVDPSGQCPPTAPCNTFPRSPGCVGNNANCIIYVPWAPHDYIACLSFSNSPDNVCRRGCLQRCMCFHPFWCRHGGVVWAICHADCIPGCSAGGRPPW